MSGGVEPKLGFGNKSDSDQCCNFLSNILVGATSFVTGGIIGSGIFITANSILLAVGSWGLALLVWLVSGLLALAGGLCWAELATVFPRQGGTYIFIKDGLGDTPSFVYIIIRYVLLFEPN